MAERDLGSTFLLPHTHLYKPDRVSILFNIVIEFALFFRLEKSIKKTCEKYGKFKKPENVLNYINYKSEM